MQFITSLSGLQLSGEVNFEEGKNNEGQH